MALTACTAPDFSEQVTYDVSNHLNTGICDDIPQGASISNIEIGDISPIPDMSMVDVSVAFDYQHGGAVKRHSTALLYLETGQTYRLAAIGGCEYGRR